jgi:hypothetical protein
MKRVFLFLATNLAIIVVLGITLRILGVERLLDDRGVNLELATCLFFPSCSVWAARSSLLPFPSGRQND